MTFEKFLKQRGWMAMESGWWLKRDAEGTRYFPVEEALWTEYNADRRLLALLGRTLVDARPTANVIAQIRIDGLLCKISDSLFGKQWARLATLTRKLKELVIEPTLSEAA